MPTTRALLGLTQEKLARWLGIPRASLALAETGRQPLPLGVWLQDARLDMARLGLVLDPAGTTSPAPPPLPLPSPDLAPLTQRLGQCRYQAWRLGHELAKLRRQAAGFEARYVALPALRAWTGPVEDPAREARWLDGFEQDAESALLYTCGAGPQRLLEARIAGLEREAELLEAMPGVVAPPPLPPIEPAP